jgi:hypothetical protein
MKALLNNVAILTVTLLGLTAQAQQQSSMELSCRAKAKEVAAQTYSSCVTDARNTQIDQIRKDYQKQLTDLKAKYDRELKKIGGKGINSVAAKPASAAPVSASTGSTPKATKGIAKTLPTRKEVKAQVAPAYQESQEEKTVASPDSTSPGVESEAPQNDANSDLKIELVPAPPSSDVSAATSGEVY